MCDTCHTNQRLIGNEVRPTHFLVSHREGFPKQHKCPPSLLTSQHEDYWNIKLRPSNENDTSFTPTGGRAPGTRRPRVPFRLTLAERSFLTLADGAKYSLLSRGKSRLQISTLRSRVELTDSNCSRREKGSQVRYIAKSQSDYMSEYRAWKKTSQNTLLMPSLMTNDGNVIETLLMTAQINTDFVNHPVPSTTELSTSLVRVETDSCESIINSTLPYKDYDSHKNSHKDFQKRFVDNPFNHGCSICDR
ncbi:uncharacterized protein TNCV_3481841 [Trichonephila clavipes]|nr:uncharacterized protein TNCV_3481841 [Trichonephila clavipes]